MQIKFLISISILIILILNFKKFI